MHRYCCIIDAPLIPRQADTDHGPKRPDSSGPFSLGFRRHFAQFPEAFAKVAFGRFAIPDNGAVTKAYVALPPVHTNPTSIF